MRNILVLALISLYPICKTTAKRNVFIEKETDSITVNTDIIEKEKSNNFFIKAKDILIDYLDYYDYDTTYIRPTKYVYSIMFEENSAFENYSINSIGENAQTLKLAPNHSYKIGLYFGWHSLFLGFSINTADFFSHSKGSNKKTEYYFNLYGYKVGGDIFYRRSGNDFKIRETKGFFKEGEKYDFGGVDFDGFKVEIMGFNVYYIFNNKHFSYPAAYSQTTIQKVSRGTLLTGLSWSKHNFKFDYNRLPPEILENMNEEVKFSRINYSDFNINFGYAYNWVFAKNCLAAISLTPAIAYKTSTIKADNSLYNQTYHDINMDFITRGGLVYNNNRFFAGTSAVMHIYQYYQNNFSLTDNFGVLNFYIGFNFGKQK